MLVSSQTNNLIFLLSFRLLIEALICSVGKTGKHLWGPDQLFPVRWLINLGDERTFRMENQLARCARSQPSL